MSLVVKLLIGGWGITLTMIGLCALNESGKLLLLHKRIGQWLEALASPVVAASENSSVRPDVS